MQVVFFGLADHYQIDLILDFSQGTDGRRNGMLCIRELGVHYRRSAGQPWIKQNGIGTWELALVGRRSEGRREGQEEGAIGGELADG